MTLAQTKIPILYCPSDNADAAEYRFLAHYETSNYNFTGLIASFPTAGRTNYSACAGVLGNTGDGFYAQYKGAFYAESSEQLKFMDGTSNTILFGEALGDRIGGNTYSIAWMGGTNLPTYWELWTPGDWYAYGSNHTSVVQFCFGDGSVRGFRFFDGSSPTWLTPQWYAFQSAAGTRDGQPITFSLLE